jgi:folate-binding protein YgfZ
MDPETSITRLTPNDLTLHEAEATLRGAAVVRPQLTTLSVTGPGAVVCMQGVVTNDIEAPGAHGFVYGAVLTPKGMIVTDLWLARAEADLLLFLPPDGREPLEEIFRRSLPPRLARATDREGIAVFQLLGPAAHERVAQAGVGVPPPGQATEGTVDEIPYHSARPSLGIPFSLQLDVPNEFSDAMAALLTNAGITAAPVAALDLARVFAGWPKLGSEIGAKTLPQEVRYDDIDGVSYTKGCFTGQETVARVHYRGHVNRCLAGLRWDAEPDLDDTDILLNGKAVGSVTSIVWASPLERWVGLGMLRREVAPGAAVMVGHARAVVHPLPLDIT